MLLVVISLLAYVECPIGLSIPKPLLACYWRTDFGQVGESDLLPK